ncbi:MAG: hypothetical protein M1368_01680, partial [Thaumarchaeota archaeon]|nr:hypothetical protein [Nitrososphaerota archaeon]
MENSPAKIDLAKIPLLFLKLLYAYLIREEINITYNSKPRHPIAENIPAHPLSGKKIETLNSLCAAMPTSLVKI